MVTIGKFWVYRINGPSKPARIGGVIVFDNLGPLKAIIKSLAMWLQVFGFNREKDVIQKVFPLLSRKDKGKL